LSKKEKPVIVISASKDALKRIKVVDASGEVEYREV